MNKGIELATGDVIGFLNSDDFYFNDKVVKKVARVFKQDPSLEASYADLIYVDQKILQRLIVILNQVNSNRVYFLKGWCPPHPTFFVRKSVYERYGNFNINYNLASDVDLMMRFLEKYKIKSHYTSEIWVKMRTGGVSNKNLKNIWNQNKEILNSFYKNGLRVNPIYFFIHKIISRSKQFIKKYTLV